MFQPRTHMQSDTLIVSHKPSQSGSSVLPPCTCYYWIAALLPQLFAPGPVWETNEFLTEPLEKCGNYTNTVI